ncbi:MAG TPA: hypothetical protein H9867_08170 [Candidatus Corynebacterium gallistercoris]|uniref:Methionine synthase n=1 Tax=Candidatus Corynebacterium gallistercoris TaxID=2838530 RepID=A0A9D1URV7_9CORY|nr:hypothetical protein [Candidatus Corynebacterium gallistercoris]
MAGAAGFAGAAGAAEHGVVGWWENTITNHTSAAEACLAALRRTVDVDEDAPAPVSIPRVTGLTRSSEACTMAIAQVPIRTNPRGWELSAHPSLDSRRTAGWLRELTDSVEELWTGKVSHMMLHVTGPWSLGAALEYRGHAVMADRPAFRDIALQLGEGVREFAAWGQRIGAEVVVAVHEPRVAEVLAGLRGATDFHSVPPVDRDIVAGVWRRFLEVGFPAVLDCGWVPPELADALPGMGFHRVAVPSAQLADTAGKDLVGGLLGAGQGIGWVFEGDATSRAGETIAGDVLRQWRQWSLPEDELPGMVDVVVPEGVRTAAAASEAAAAARIAAEKLWRN